jgi:hypothetical protein
MKKIKINKMKKSYPNRIVGFLMTVLFAVSGNLYAESSSFGHVFMHHNDEVSTVVIGHAFTKKGKGQQFSAVDSNRKIVHSLFNFSKNNDVRSVSDILYLNNRSKIYSRTPSAAITNDNVINIAPPVIIQVSNTCPETTVNLNSYVNSTPPVGSVISWHTGTPATVNNMITNAQAMAISTTSGPYYPAYYDASSTACFSPTGTPINVTINFCCTVIAPTIASAIVQPSCGTPTGTINITPQTGFEYSIDGVSYQSSPLFSGLNPGSYTLYVRNTVDPSCKSQSINPVTINAFPLAPSTPTVASTTQPSCNLTTGTIVFTSQSVVEYSIDNGLNYQSSTTFVGLAAGIYTLKVKSTTDATCTTAAASTVTINAVPTANTPSLTVSSAVCNGTTYNVSFNSNGVVTASTGTVTGTTITGISVGTDVIVTSTAVNGCANTQTTVVSPTSCVTPPIGCTTPTISAGSGVCSGIGTYSVSVTVSSGATISASTGTVSGNSVTGIALGTEVTITATNGTCTSLVKVSSPTDCTTACSGIAVSYSVGGCLGTTYNVSISNPNGATISASVGTVTATVITNIPVGTDVTLTATATGCAPEVVLLSAPKATTPSLTVSSAVCNGTTYNVSFNSNGVVTASTGTVTGTTITGIAVGTDVIVTSTAVNGCASTQTTVVSPTSCVTPPIGCTTPTISAGSGVCSGIGTYSVSVTASSGATISASTGTVSGNSVTGITLGTVVTITATNGTCTSLVKVSSPTDCTTACAGTAVSYSVGGCLGTTYNVSISNPNGAMISASVGTVTATAITNIPVGTDVTLTATAVGCSAEIVILSSPASCVIDAVDDDLIAVNGITTSVLLNDTLKGILPIIGTAIGNVKLTSTATIELSIDTTTGVITVTPNTPVGSYSISYTICEVNNPANCNQATATVTVTAPDFLPSIIIDDVVFLTSGETRDFIVNISEFGFGSSIGQVVFVIPKLSAFTITNNPSATSSNVAGGTTINNSDWIITENSTFIKATLKPIAFINNSSFSKIGFSISRKINIPSKTWQNLTLTIKNGTGLDNVNTNNTHNVLLKAE